MTSYARPRWRGMVSNPLPNPLLTLEGHLTAVLRTIEPQLDSLFQRAVDGSWVEMWMYESVEESIDAMSDLLAKIKNLPPFIKWAMEFEGDANGAWFE